MVARGVPGKGWEDAVAAVIAANTTRSGQDQLHLTCVGEGAELERLEAIVSDPAVAFVGHQRDVASIIRQSDVGLLPSQSELLPMFVAECLREGVPVIASDVGAVREMLSSERGDAGTLIALDQAGDVDRAQLVDAITRHAADPALVKAHSECAVHAFQKFRLEVCVARYMAFFDEIGVRWR
jgi:glycosyltransferase involved in cell wall biosynthesis